METCLKECTAFLHRGAGGNAARLGPLPAYYSMGLILLVLNTCQSRAAALRPAQHLPGLESLG